MKVQKVRQFHPCPAWVLQDVGLAKYVDLANVVGRMGGKLTLGRGSASSYKIV